MGGERWHREYGDDEETGSDGLTHPQPEHEQVERNDQKAAAVGQQPREDADRGHGGDENGTIPSASSARITCRLRYRPHDPEPDHGEDGTGRHE